MLLLPTTLATLSVAFSAALLPVQDQDDAAGQPAGPPGAASVQLPQAGAGGQFLPGCALASACTQSDQVQANMPEGETPELAATADIDGFGPAADAASLDGMRGGDGNSGNAIVMNGTVADNRATNVVTGTNMITEGSFANASGVPMVVQNTGANVLIQNATVINLQLR